MLREFRESDARAVHPIVGDDRVTKWLSFDSRSVQEAENMLHGVLERATLQPRTEYYLAVEHLDSPGSLVGFARLALSGVRAGKLGYAVAYQAWGRGIATEAARLLVDFGFQVLELHRVSAAAGPDNPASIKVIEKLGFTREGRIRDHVFTNGAWRDSILYSILEHEWIGEPEV
nr:GNAT family protein [Glycomyces sp. L485]